MNVHFPARHRWASRLAHMAVVIVVLALAAATFVLSYTGVHSIALQAGVSARLARIYPGVFDAALVIACVTALMLREGHWWARAYAWLSIILVIVVVGAADAVHAMNVALPQRKTAGVVAAAPWVLVLLGFSLWLTMLRQSRTQHANQPPQPTVLEPTVLEPAPPAETPEEEDARTPESAGEARDETSPDEGQPVPEQAAVPEQATAESETTDEPGAPPRDYWDTGNADEPPLPFTTVPRLKRVRSTPTPPEERDEDQ